MNPRKGPKWVVTPGVFVLFTLSLLAAPASARTVVHFPASQTVTTGTFYSGTSFPACAMVLGDYPYECFYDEEENAGGAQKDFTLLPCCGLFQPQLWVTSGSDNGCNIGAPWACIDEIPENDNTTYTYTEYCPVFLPPDPACSFLQYWDTNGTDHYVVEPCSSTPGCGPVSDLANITLTEYSHALYVDTNVSAPPPDLGIDVYVSGTLCDPDGANSLPVTLAWSNVTDPDDLSNCTIDVAALDLLEIGFRGMCSTGSACDELRNTQGGINLNYTAVNYALDVTYDWVGLSRTVPTVLRLNGGTLDSENFTASIYNWTAVAYDLVGNFTTYPGTFLNYTVYGPDQISPTGTLRMRFVDSSTDGTPSTMTIDYAAVTQTMPDFVNPPSPILDWMLILILLILWVSFSAIGIAKPSGLLFMGGALCGIILAFFFVLPVAELPGIAVLGLAMTCMLGGAGIAISSGGEAG